MLNVPTIAVPTNHATVVGIIEARQYPSQARHIVIAAASSVVAASMVATKGLVAILTPSITIARRLGIATAIPSASTTHTSIAVSRVFKSGAVHITLRKIELPPGGIERAP